MGEGGWAVIALYTSRDLLVKNMGEGLSHAYERRVKEGQDIDYEYVNDPIVK